MVRCSAVLMCSLKVKQRVMAGTTNPEFDLSKKQWGLTSTRKAKTRGPQAREHGAWFLGKG